MEELTVRLAGREYPIHVGAGAFDVAIADFAKLAEKGRRVFCFADTAVLESHADAAGKLAEVAEIVELEGGEKTKTLEMFGGLCAALADRRADRKSAVAAFGGGVVGDLSGFVAASYMRGVDFYQIPTTLLAAVDSSVGGKTGVNIPEGKNLVGAFHQPKAVYTDSEFLKSLPRRQFAAGMAEVVKCAVLGDAGLFERLAARGKPMAFDSPELGDAVVSSCKLKAKIVAEDERETSPDGGRALLNLGHTFGHAIERNAGYGNYLHGEAVSIGTVMAAVLSRRLGLIGDAQVDAIARLLRSEGLPVSLAERISADDFIDAMHGDKKALAGALRFVTILDIGKTRTETVPDAVVRDAIADFYKR